MLCQSLHMLIYTGYILLDIILLTITHTHSALMHTLTQILYTLVDVFKFFETTFYLIKRLGIGGVRCKK